MTKKLRLQSNLSVIAGLVLTLSFLLPISSYSQSTNNALNLKEVLKILQKRYNADFNYADEILIGLNAPLPPEDFSFEQAISYLQRVSPLVFQHTTEKIVVITRDSKNYYKGKILDASSRKPIAFASIHSKFSNTISDSMGLFQIELYSKDSLLHISHVAYGTLSFKILPGKKNELKIFMRNQPTTLREVVIDDFIVRGISKKESGEYYINFEDFSMLPGLIKTDVLQAIQALPGVMSVNETVSNINIRGGTHDQNLLLWDGIKMYQSGHFFGLISMFNPDITQHANVIRNGSPSAFTDGVSGTIDITTNQSLNQQFKGKAGIDFLNASLFTDIPLGKKASLQVAARKSHSELFKTPTYNEYFHRVTQNTELANNVMDVINSDVKFDFYDISFRGLVELSDRDLLRFNFIYSKNDLFYTESATLAGNLQSRESSLGQRSIAEGIYFQRKWNKYWSSNLHIYETDYKLKGINANVPENQRFLQENIVSETGVKFETSKHGKHTTWTNGYQFVETKITNIDDVDIPIFRTLEGEVIRTHGLFSQLDYSSFNGKINFNSGLRLNYIEKFDKWRLEPRINVSYRLNGHISFELQGELKHQNSSQIVNFQNDFLGIEKRRWQLANEEGIPMITSQQISAGLIYDRLGLLMSGEVYYKQVNGITSQSQGFQTKYEFVKSIGDYEVMGFDFLLRKRFNTVYIWAGYSLMDNTYTFNELADKTFPSNLDISHSFAAGTNYEKGPIKFSLGFNWRTGLPLSTPVASEEIINNEVNFGPANLQRLPNYLRLDFSVNYDIILPLSRKLSLSASVWNLLNTKNSIGRYFRSNDNTLNSIDEESLGITPNVLLQYYF